MLPSHSLISFLALLNVGILIHDGVALNGRLPFRTRRSLMYARDSFFALRSSVRPTESGSLQEALFQREIETAMKGTWLDPVSTLPLLTHVTAVHRPTPTYQVVTAFLMDI